MSYTTFAKIYDDVMDPALYLKWLEFTQEHLAPETQTIMDLACGSGIFAVALAKEGYRVTGLDLSSDMLALAEGRALAEGAEIEFLEGDMTELGEVGVFDAVTCYSDSLCYLPDEAAMLAAFRGVWQNLTAGGRFLFDVHSLYQIDQVFPDYSYHYQTDEYAFLWDSYPGEVRHSIEHFLTFFIEESNGSFARFDELHRERTYSLATYQKLLQEAGFKKTEMFADFASTPPSDKSRRWFFVCEK